MHETNIAKIRSRTTTTREYGYKHESAEGMSYVSIELMRIPFFLEDSSDFGGRHPLGGIAPPSILYHLPYATRELRVVRPARSNVIQ